MISTHNFNKNWLIRSALTTPITFFSIHNLTIKCCMYGLVRCTKIIVSYIISNILIFKISYHYRSGIFRYTEISVKEVFIGTVLKFRYIEFLNSIGIYTQSITNFGIPFYTKIAVYQKYQYQNIFLPKILKYMKFFKNFKCAHHYRTKKIYDTRKLWYTKKVYIFSIFCFVNVIY